MFDSVYHIRTTYGTEISIQWPSTISKKCGMIMINSYIVMTGKLGKVLACRFLNSSHFAEEKTSPDPSRI